MDYKKAKVVMKVKIIMKIKCKRNKMDDDLMKK
jgi:hypothetical protein